MTLKSDLKLFNSLACSLPKEANVSKNILFFTVRSVSKIFFSPIIQSLAFLRIKSNIN